MSGGFSRGTTVSPHLPIGSSRNESNNHERDVKLNKKNESILFRRISDFFSMKFQSLSFPVVKWLRQAYMPKQFTPRLSNHTFKVKLECSMVKLFFLLFHQKQRLSTFKKCFMKYMQSVFGAKMIK